MRNAATHARSPFRVSLLAAALALPAPASFAEELEEIVVSARKRAESLETAPVAITALSARQLEQYNITRMEDMSSLAGGGVIISKNGVSPTISIRGVSSDATNAGFDQSVGIIIDGVFYDRSRWTQQGFFDVAQVEVLKGPQSLYFGKSTVAGAVALSTANPGDEFEASITAGHEFEASEWYGEGIVSGPVTEDLGARLALRASKSDGWLENTAPGVATKDFAGEEELTARLTLQWEPAEDVSVNFKIQAAKNEDDGPATRAQLYNCRGGSGVAVTGQPTDLQGPPFFAAFPISGVDDCKLNRKITVYAGPPGLEFAQKPEGESDALLTSLKIDWRAGDWDITSVTGWNDYTLDDTTGYISSQGLISAIQTESNTAFSQELRALSDFDGPVNFLVGVNYQDTEFRFDNASQIILAIPDPRNGRAASQDHRATQDGKSMSAFGEITWDINEQWTLSGGARFTREEKDPKYDLTFVNQWFGILFPFPFWLPEGTVFEDNFSDDNVSPQATLEWRPRDGLTVFASYKTGFLPGGFSLGATPQAGLTIDDFLFDSEEVEGWELGFKTQLLDERMSIDVIAYDYEFTDLQVNLYVPATASFVVGNAGEANTTGLEAGMRFRMNDNVSLRAFATFNDGEYAGYRTQCYTLQTAAEGCDPATGTQDLDGKSLPRAPDKTFGAGAVFTLPTSVGEISLSADAYWSDEYQIETTNNPFLVQDSYWRFDASLAFETNDGHWRAMLIGRNLGNEVITSFGATRGFSTDQLAELMPLREVSAQLTYRF